MIDPSSSTTPASSNGLKYGVSGVAVVLLLCMAAFEYLNFSGFCYSDMRFYSDRELIAAAVHREVMINKAYAQSDRRVDYETAEDLIAKNPDCCLVTRGDSPLLQERIWSRMVGSYVLLVEVLYRAKEQGAKPYYSDIFFVGACGNILDRSGSEEATPKLITSR